MRMRKKYSNIRDPFKQTSSRRSSSSKFIIDEKSGSESYGKRITQNGSSSRWCLNTKKFHIQEKYNLIYFAAAAAELEMKFFSVSTAQPLNLRRKESCFFSANRRISQCRVVNDVDSRDRAMNGEKWQVGGWPVEYRLFDFVLCC